MTRILLQQAAQTLRGVTSVPRREAEILLAYVLAVDRMKLWTDAFNLTSEQISSFDALVQRRAQGEPLAYLVQSKEFWKFRLKVTSDVLIPREDTEILVTESLVRLDKNKANRVLELGTGSGAIALALAYELPQSHFIATDKSVPALALAQYNAQQLGITHIEFLLSDWYDKVTGFFDLIVTNPPYIAFDDPALDASVKDYEPSSAVFSQDQGLGDIKLIVSHAARFLNPQGWLLVEHGYQQGGMVRMIFKEAGLSQINTLADLNGLERVTLGTLQAR